MRHRGKSIALPAGVFALLVVESKDPDEVSNAVRAILDTGVETGPPEGDCATRARAP